MVKNSSNARCATSELSPPLSQELKLSTHTSPPFSSIYAKDLKSVKWYDPVGAQLIASSTSAASTSTSAPPPSSSYEADLAKALALSSLESKQKSSPNSRETLKMRLVRRPQITTLALPRSSTWPSDAVPPLRAPWQFTPDAFAYAKFMLGAPDYMKDELTAQEEELQREIATLRRWGQRGATDEELGVAFVEAALRRVDEQLEKVEALKTRRRLSRFLFYCTKACISLDTDTDPPTAPQNTRDDSIDRLTATTPSMLPSTSLSFVDI